MNFHIKDGPGLEFTAQEGEMMKQEALTRISLFCTSRTIFNVAN